MSWLVVRALGRGDDRLWLVAGVVLGVGLLNKPLPAFLAVGLLAASRSPARALCCATVRLGRRGDRLACGRLARLAGRPRLAAARRLALDRRGQLDQLRAVVGDRAVPVPAGQPVARAGLGGRARARCSAIPMRDLRFLGWAWVVLAVVFMASGGKPYYLAGLLPLLLAAGAVRWTRGSRAAPRAAGALLAAVVLSGIVGVDLALPVLPADGSDPSSRSTRTSARRSAGPTSSTRSSGVTAISRARRDLTRNYGEAGAIERTAPGLPPPTAATTRTATGARRRAAPGRDRRRLHAGEMAAH